MAVNDLTMFESLTSNLVHEINPVYKVGGIIVSNIGVMDVVLDEISSSQGIPRLTLLIAWTRLDRQNGVNTDCVAVIHPIHAPRDQ